MKFPFRLKNKFNSVVIVILVVLVQKLTIECRLLDSVSSLGDGCDWTGSDLWLDDNTGRGVTPVYLRCSQGHLEWQYPRSALRVLLRLGASGRDFRGCIKVSGSFAGAHIFLKGPRSLLPLFQAHHDDETPRELARCFQSRDGQAALYMEAISSRAAIYKEVAAFSYDLTPLPRGTSYYDSQEDCRPCTSGELIRLYCCSDFVARGIITAVKNNEFLDRSEVSARVSKVYRQIHPVFKPHNMSAFEYSLLEQEQNFLKDLSIVTNTLMDSSNSGGNISYSPRYQYGTIYVPLHCGAKHGPGEFIFMGRFVLDDPVLTCAPRLEDWIQVQRTAVKEGNAQCSLET